MDTHLPWYVVNPEGFVVAEVDRLELAAAVVAITGGRIKGDDEMVLWAEGCESFSAAESYDRCAEVCWDRFTGKAFLLRSQRRF